jgi:probable rRNA maturation factor
MARVAVSIRLKNPSIKDSLTGENLVIEDCHNWGQLAENVFQATFKPYFSNQEIVLSFVENDEMFQLNSLYRNIEASTDVLSFNAIGNLAEDLEKFRDIDSEDDLSDEDLSIGDVVICIDYAIQQTKEKNSSLKEELAMLFVHGVLHLLGYDHSTKEESEEMFKLQDKILEGKFTIQSLK